MNQSINNKKHTVLLTGATGFLGKHLGAKLYENPDFSVKAAVRKYAEDLSIPQSDQCLINDINSETKWEAALKGCDRAVHMAARVHVMKEDASDPLAEFRRINVDGTLNLARQAADQGIKRFVFVSSIKVNGEKTSRGFSYTTDVAEIPKDPYGLSKYEAEEGLKEIAVNTGMEVVIIRPPMIYGPGVKGNFQRLVNLINKGYPLPLAHINNKRSFVSIYNLCDLIQCCLIHPAAANQTFLVSDNEDLSTSELLQKMAEALEIKPHLFWFPKGVLKFSASVLGKGGEISRLVDSLQVDISDTMDKLNWKPAVNVESALKQTLRC